MKMNKAKRNDLLFEILRTVIAIAIAMILVVIIVLVSTDNPKEVLHTFIFGPVSSIRRMSSVIEMMIPLSFCGLAVAFCFRAKQFNLAADGAFYAGAMIAVVVGLALPLPAPIVVIICIAAGFLIGGIIGSIPAVLKLKCGASELVTSLMLNSIVGLGVLYVLKNHIWDPSKTTLTQSYTLADGIDLGNLAKKTNLHWGFFIMIICIVFCTILMFRTKWGYSLRMTGSNANFAKFSGISTGFVVIFAQAFGTALAGMGGAIEILGIHHALKWEAAPSYGFDGVIIAALARNNPALVPFAALFLAYLRVGADMMSQSIPAEIISVIQAIIILLIGSQAFLARWKQRMLVKQTIKNDPIPTTAATEVS